MQLLCSFKKKMQQANAYLVNAYFLIHGKGYVSRKAEPFSPNTSLRTQGRQRKY